MAIICRYRFPLSTSCPRSYFSIISLSLIQSIDLDVAPLISINVDCCPCTEDRRFAPFWTLPLSFHREGNDWRGSILTYLLATSLPEAFALPVHERNPIFVFFGLSSLWANKEFIHLACLSVPLSVLCIFICLSTWYLPLFVWFCASASLYLYAYPQTSLLANQ